jgi:hypothetical protein
LSSFSFPEGFFPQEVVEWAADLREISDKLLIEISKTKEFLKVAD